MDEADHVSERLKRIERLAAGGAPRPVVLGELRALLEESEALLAANRPSLAQAGDGSGGRGSPAESRREASPAGA